MNKSIIILGIFGLLFLYGCTDDDKSYSEKYRQKGITKLYEYDCQFLKDKYFAKIEFCPINNKWEGDDFVVCDRCCLGEECGFWDNRDWIHLKTIYEVYIDKGCVNNE